jgi:hypothetical protein
MLVLNTTDCAGKLKQADKLRYFLKARGSVMECAALSDLLSALGHPSPDECRAGELLLARIGAMLSKPCLQGVAGRGLACSHSFSGGFKFTCASIFTSGNANLAHSIPR